MYKYCDRCPRTPSKRKAAIGSRSALCNSSRLLASCHVLILVGISLYATSHTSLGMRDFTKSLLGHTTALTPIKIPEDHKFEWEAHKGKWSGDKAPVKLAASCPPVAAGRTSPVPIAQVPIEVAKRTSLAEPLQLSPIWLLREKTTVSWPYASGSSTVFKTNFLDNRRFNDGNDWWQNIKADDSCWEIFTFDVFKSVLTARPGALIDFGTWIGVTALFGARFATRTLALEPDPMAFEQMRANFALAEPTIRARTTVFFRCISTDDKPLVMHGKGDSMSSLLGGILPGVPQWSVPCTPLPQLVRDEGLLPGEISLIKMDIEGAESTVFPSLGPWLKEQGLPTIWLSLHCAWWNEDTDVKKRIIATMSLYKYTYLGPTLILDPQLTDLHGLQEWLLSPTKVKFLSH